MICTTIRDGVECAFMKKNGCSYNAGACLEIIEACKGCKRSVEFSSGWYCGICPDPSKKWKLSKCNVATHVSDDSSKNKAKRKINPLKASKRGKN
jgi:hypothetical protein